MRWGAASYSPPPRTRSVRPDAPGERRRELWLHLADDGSPAGEAGGRDGQRTVDLVSRTCQPFGAAVGAVVVVVAVCDAVDRIPMTDLVDPEIGDQSLVAIRGRDAVPANAPRARSADGTSHEENGGAGRAPARCGDDGHSCVCAGEVDNFAALLQGALAEPDGHSRRREGRPVVRDRTRPVGARKAIVSRRGPYPVDVYSRTTAAAAGLCRTGTCRSRPAGEELPVVVHRKAVR